MRTIPVMALLVLSGSVHADADLPRSSPEAQGVSSPKIQAFVEAADKSIDSLHGFVLVRHGHVIAEGWWAPYSADAPHELYSLSKSFTSTAVGLAIAEGKLRLDDPILKFFPNDAPASPSANLKAMRLSDLLRMSTGQQSEPPRKADEPWAKTFLNHAVPFKPGTHFMYNTSATYMLSAAVQKATGQTVLDYLKPRLFEPLGIANPTWVTSPQGISAGGYGLSVRTADIAKFGQLYLQKGKWQGKQLVPSAWVEAATSLQTSNGSNPNSDWDQGYGYQFWRCRHEAYRGDGAFGQFCIVLPKQDAVIAITAGVGNMQAVLNRVWDKLLPAFEPSPLPENDSAWTTLSGSLKRLSLHLPKSKGTPAKVAGRKYVFPANDPKLDSILVKGVGKNGETTIVTRIGGKEQQIVCRPGAWHQGRFAWNRLLEQPAATGGAWTSDDTLTAKICFYQTPFVVTLRLKFTQNEVRIDSQQNVGFGPLKTGPLVGTAE